MDEKKVVAGEGAGRFTEDQMVVFRRTAKEALFNIHTAANCIAQSGGAQRELFDLSLRVGTRHFFDLFRILGLPLEEEEVSRRRHADIRRANMRVRELERAWSGREC